MPRLPLNHPGLIGLWGLAVLLILTGCAYADSVEPEAIYLGLIVPVSGDLATMAGAMLNGANFAIDQVNDEGGLVVGGKRYRLILFVEDDQNAPDQAVEATRRLVFQHDVQAIIGPVTSRTALAAAPVAEALGAPMISPTATHPDLTAGRDYIFRVSFNDEFQGQVMAEFARDNLQAQRAAVLYDMTNTYNRRIAEIFRSKFIAAGGQVVAFEAYLVGESDFRPHLGRIQAVEPDLIFLPNFSADVLFQAQQAREMGITAVFLGSDSWERQRLAPEPALNGAYFSAHYNPEQSNASNQSFVSAYQERYGMPPTGGAALVYDAFQLTFKAMQNEGAVDREATQRGLSAMTEFHGVTGAMRYEDGRHDPVRSAVILQLSDQQARFFQLVDP
jgi:branched-chain amino acid transport system substrate-binding protein